MNQNWITYLQLLKLQKQQRKRIGAVIAALSIAVTGSVSWKLHGIGTAMVDEALTDSGERYAETLSADGSIYENPSVWEATLPDISGFPLSERIAAVAESQLGYQDSRWSFTNELGEELQKRYSRYGDWYGNPSGDWNTMFTYFCLHYGGADENTVSYGSGCWAWSVELEKNGLIIPVSRGSPQRGDVIFLDTDLDGKADRSGVITCISGEEEQQLLKAAEGDVEGAVAEQEYAFSDEYLIGYLHIEAVEDDAPPDETESPEDAQTQSAECREFSGVTDSGITVRAVADENAFPADTVMTVSDIAREEAVKAAADSLGKEEDALDAVAVDISFRDADGTEIEPAPESSVQVQISLPEELRLGSGAYSLLHVSDEGDVQTVENASVSADGAEFDAESFSIYVLTGDKGYVEKSGLVMVNNYTGANDADHPYMIYVGEEIKIRYTGEYKDAGRITVFGNDLSGGAHHINRIDETGEPGYNSNEHDVVTDEFRQALFKGSVAGDCRIAMLRNKNWGTENIAESLYVRVIDPIYVKTYYGEKGKDWIREYLGGYSFIQDKNGYIQNTSGKSYILRVEDTINVRSNAEGSFAIQGDGGTYLRQIASQYDGYVTYEAIAPTPKDSNDNDIPVQINHQNGSTVNDTIYVRVLNTTLTGWGAFTHVDMEIADDGKYTLTEFTDTGRIEKVYKAYITKINDSTKLYDKNGNLVNIMPVDAYRKLGVPEQTQYEMTSAYYVRRFDYVGETSLLHFDEYSVYANDNGTWIEWDPDNPGPGNPFFDTETHLEYLFDPNQIAAVDFNVQITLYPDEEIVYEGDTIVSRTPITGEDPQVMKSNKVHFESQAIKDALNKCPLDNGLDFTYKPEGALVKLQASKKLSNTGVMPKAGQFQFELINAVDTYKALKVVTSNGDGQLTNLTVSPTDVFPDFQPEDKIEAYIIADHSKIDPGNPVNTFGNGIDGSSYYSATGKNWMDVCNQIDGFHIGGSLIAGEQAFYDKIKQYLIPANAIHLNEDGNIVIPDPGAHVLFKKTTVERIASNDENGHITFPYLAFTENDKNKTFTYYMKEIPNPLDESVETFDETVHTVTITIGNDMSVTVKYDGTDNKPEFTNKLYEYQLPATGGTGTVPYAMTGMTMIAGATWLLLRTRRKEDN